MHRLPAWDAQMLAAHSRYVTASHANLAKAPEPAQLPMCCCPIDRPEGVSTDSRVSGIEATFNTDFTHTSSPPAPGVVPAGSELIWAPGAQTGLVNLINSARPGTTLYVEDQLLDSTPIEQAFVADAKKGVTVDVAMTYSASYVAGFNTLVAGGVHLNLYYRDTPLYIQAKALLVNGDTAYIGSINFTTAMTNDDRNVGIITANPTVVKGLTPTIASDFAGATPYSKSG